MTNKWTTEFKIALMGGNIFLEHKVWKYLRIHFKYSVYFESYTDITVDSDWQSVVSKACD